MCQLEPVHRDAVVPTGPGPLVARDLRRAGQRGRQGAASGVEGRAERSTRADANRHRPWQLYQTVFGQWLEKCQGVVAQRGGTPFRFKNTLMSLDASVIDMSLSLFDWARCRRTTGAITLHRLLDHDGDLPSFAVITEGRTSDLTVARRMRFEPGTVLVIDRGYIDDDWFVEVWNPAKQEAIVFLTTTWSSARRRLPPSTRTGGRSSCSSRR